MKTGYNPNLYTDEEYKELMKQNIDDMEPLVVNGVYLLDMQGLEYELFLLACHHTPEEDLKRLLDQKDADTARALDLAFSDGTFDRNDAAMSILNYLYKIELSSDDPLAATTDEMINVRKARHTPERLAWKKEIRKTKPSF